MGKEQVNSIQQGLLRLERRDWWLWWTAMAVMLLLTFAVVSFTMPSLQALPKPRFLFDLGQSARSLVALVLLFELYVIYQQVTIKMLRGRLATQVEATSKMTVTAEEFHQLSIIDSLTGLYNRRLLEERLSAEIARSSRHGHPLAIILLDLNDFKQINDTNGHAAGDLVLKEFSALLKNAVRPSDVPARIGGDEFVVLLPECQPGQVGSVLARLKPGEVNYGNVKIPYSFCAGYADMRSGEKPDSFMERADRDLYVQKRARKSDQRPPAATV